MVVVLAYGGGDRWAAWDVVVNALSYCKCMIALIYWHFHSQIYIIHHQNIYSLQLSPNSLYFIAYYLIALSDHSVNSLGTY